MSKKSLKKTEIIANAKKVPFIIYLIVMSLILISAFALVVFLIIRLISSLKNNNDDFSQLLIALVPIILSLIIASNGLFTVIINHINGAKEDDKQKTIILTQFIDTFNNRYLFKINKVSNIMNYIYSNNNIPYSFKASLEKQEDKINELDTYISQKGIDFMSEYLYYCIISSYCAENCFSDDTRKFYTQLVKEKNSGKTISGYKNTVAAIELLRFYRKERIDILNFFENVAISFFNNTVNQQMVIYQFGSMLRTIIPLFYYFIYKNEGIDCYPYLNMMLEYIPEE